MGINDPTNNYYNSHWIGSFVVRWVVGKLLQMVVVMLCGFIQLVWNFKSRVSDLSITNFLTLQFIRKCTWEWLFKHSPIWLEQHHWFFILKFICLIEITHYQIKSHLSFFTIYTRELFRLWCVKQHVILYQDRLRIERDLYVYSKKKIWSFNFQYVILNLWERLLQCTLFN